MANDYMLGSSHHPRPIPLKLKPETKKAVDAMFKAAGEPESIVITRYERLRE